MGIKVALIPRQDVWHHCYSYCMVAAIWESLRVVGDDGGFTHFVSQNFLATSAPVSAEVGNANQLRQRRDEIFRKNFAPWLSGANHSSPRVIAAWVRQLEVEKAAMLIDIRARFDRVQTANERISQNLLTSKRAMVVLAETAACAFVVLGAGAVLFGVGMQAAAAAGFATSAEATAAAATGVQAGVASLYFNVADVGVGLYRKLSEAGEADAWVLFGLGAGAKFGSKAVEMYARLEHTKSLTDLMVLGQDVDNLLLNGSKEFLNNPYFKKYVLDYAKRKQMAIATHVTRTAVVGVGTLMCAGYELADHYREGVEGWEDETKKRAGKGE